MEEYIKLVAIYLLPPHAQIIFYKTLILPQKEFVPQGLQP